MCQSCATAFDRLKSIFGKEKAEFLLWSYTCFPFDGERTLEQANSLIDRARARPLDEVLAEEDAADERAMSQVDLT